MVDKIFNFVGGGNGQWKVQGITRVIGDSLGNVPFVRIMPSESIKSNEELWTLKGARSNLRYTEKDEEDKLVTVQAGLGRPEATCAALIPIRKSGDWWALAQD